MSCSMAKMDKLLSLSCLIVEKDLSAEAKVTGKVKAILNNLASFGKASSCIDKQSRQSLTVFLVLQHDF